MRVKFTESTRKHKVGHANVLFVMGSVDPAVGTRPTGEAEYRWTGVDERGRELDIIAIEAVDDRSPAGEVVLLVIHVFPTALKKF